jgi:hypothetical protein
MDGVCATWAYASSSITLTMLAPIPAGTPTTLIFGSNGGLTLPRDGVVENQATLTIASSAADGPVLATPVESTPPVGYFEKAPFVSFDPSVASAVGPKLQTHSKPRTSNPKP